jgi:hypothetical protein
MNAAMPNDVVAFWREAGQKKWFGGGREFDANATRASTTSISRPPNASSMRGCKQREGTLALLILLDQIRAQHLSRHRASIRDRQPGPQHRAARVDAGFDQQIDEDCACSSTCPSNTPRSRRPERAHGAVRAMPKGDDGGWAKKHSMSSRNSAASRIATAAGRESTAVLC